MGLAREVIELIGDDPAEDTSKRCGVGKIGIVKE
jgi:hypothetical protein